MSFTGFPIETERFLAELEHNNHKGWFDENRDRYETYVLEMARSFVEAMKAPLAEIDPGIVVDPRVNKSMFRINRDTRFNKEAPPYKTNIACLFWDERGKRMQTAGFYFDLSPGKLWIGGGYYRFAKPFKEKYREAVAGDAGEDLVKILGQLEADGYDVRGESLKRVPSGFDSDHPRAELLKKQGLTFMKEFAPVPEIVHLPELPDFVATHYRAAHPLIAWLGRAQFTG